MREENTDKYLIQATATALTKIALFICCTILFGMYLSNCNLDSEIIINCEESCNKNGSHMSSVTSTKCECAINGQNTWSLP